MTANDQRFADLAMKAANERTHQMIEIATLKAAARLVVRMDGHDPDCDIYQPFGACGCGWQQAHAALAALVEETP